MSVNKGFFNSFPGGRGGRRGSWQGDEITSGNITVKGDYDNGDKYRPQYFYDDRYTSFTFAKIWYVELPDGRRCFLNLSSDAFNGKPDTAYIEQAPANDAIGEHVSVSTSGYFGQGPFGNAENSVLQLHWVGYSD